MPTSPNVYIAGVGISDLQSRKSDTIEQRRSIISAATKALLEAGLIYDNITHGVISNSKSGKEAFRIFDVDASIAIDEIERGSILRHSYDLVLSRGVQCILLITIEKSLSVALVLISEDRLWRHSYLKDTAVKIRKLSTDDGLSTHRSSESLGEICRKVWMLRGWRKPTDEVRSGGRQCICHQERTITFEVSRADAGPIPEWKDIEHKQDGRDRLGHNPADETRTISFEDFEAVRTSRTERADVNESLHYKRKGGDRAALAKL